MRRASNLAVTIGSLQNGLNSKNLGCHRCSFDATLDLGKGSLTRRRSVVGKRRESTVIGRPQSIDRDELSGFNHALAHLMRAFHFRIDRVCDANEEHPPWFE